MYLCTCFYINVYVVMLPCAQWACRVPSPLVKAGHRCWLWFTERYLMSQISPTPKQNHILKLLGEFLKVNSANWQVFPLKYKVFNKHNSSTSK